MTLVQTYGSSIADFKIEKEIIYCLVLLVLQLERKIFEVMMETLCLFNFPPNPHYLRLKFSVMDLRD